MKIISMYLPQFHKVKENDEWWGDGYTEWTAVKNADKLYDEHIQPKIPLNENYYDLTEKITMEWQADLMCQYGIDGQCFYHYWFKNNRQILEKPVENLLHWTDIKMHFCFCWANETWARTWSNIQEKNGWAAQFEKTEDHFGSGILLEQQYGDERDWKIHYEYLKEYFKDDRYIKYNGKPLFLIYKTYLIECLGDMLAKWNEWALEDGFNGIYVIGAYTNIDTEKYLDGILYHEPQNAILRNSGRIEYGVVKYNYEELWKTIIHMDGFGRKVYYGGFVGYDDTPRRGKGGTVIEGSSPELFQKYFSMLIAKNCSKGNEFVFLNAWNEWGEGMYLEPDMKYRYSYLEAVKKARKCYTEYTGYHEECFINFSLKKELDFYRKKTYQYEKYWKVFDMWMELRERGQKLEDYLIRQNIRRIGIYGAGMMGKHLIAELSGSKVDIAYAIDQKADFIDAAINIYGIDEIYPEVDAIVITVLSDTEKIKMNIEKKLSCKIILLEKLIVALVNNYSFE